MDDFGNTLNDAAVNWRNVSGNTFSYFLPCWMILTNLSANALNIETQSTLVANHMRTLLEICHETSRIKVAYPTEPISALSAHLLFT